MGKKGLNSNETKNKVTTMSDLNIRRALATLLNTAGIPLSNIAYENTTFEPDGLEFYIEFSFFPATETGAGKTPVDDSEQNGFVQVSVFTKLNANDYGTLYLQTIDSIKGAFQSGAETSYNNQNVAILDSTNINPSPSEAWYQGGLTVNYRAFKKRV